MNMINQKSKTFWSFIKLDDRRRTLQEDINESVQREDVIQDTCCSINIPIDSHCKF